jgi:hypothetical protein
VIKFEDAAVRSLVSPLSTVTEAAPLLIVTVGTGGGVTVIAFADDVAAMVSELQALQLFQKLFLVRVWYVCVAVTVIFALPVLAPVTAVEDAPDVSVATVALLVFHS